MPLPSSRAGFTLLEMMAGLAMLGLLLSLATPSWNAWIQRQRLETASRELQSLLAQWRHVSLDAQQPVRLSLYTASGSNGSTTPQCAVIHTGAWADCRCAPDPAGRPRSSCQLPAQQLSEWVLRREDGLALSANVGSLRMDPHLGTVTPSGTLSLRGPGELEVRHVVNVMGRVRVCSDARIGGWPAC